jgi:hypothetical protein
MGTDELVAEIPNRRPVIRETAVSTPAPPLSRGNLHTPGPRLLTDEDNDKVIRDARPRTDRVVLQSITGTTQWREKKGCYEPPRR